MFSISEARRVLEAVDLVQGLTHPEVLTRLQQGLHLRATGQRILAFYLVEMDARRLYQSTGHRSTAFYAETHLGLDHRRTSELLHVGRTLLELPTIDQAFCERRLGWSKLLHLVRVVTPEHEQAWLERAIGLGVSELALQVRLAKRGSAPRRPGESKGTPEVRFPHACQLAPLAHQKVELAKEKLAAERGHAVSEAEYQEAMAELFLSLQQDGSAPGHTRVDASLYRVVLRPAEEGGGALAVETAEGPVPLAADGSIDVGAVVREAEVVVVGDDEGPDAVATDTPAPTTPARLRERIIARDGGRCRGCGARRDLRVHHIRYRSAGGPTKAFNLITLCLACHSLVHADLLVLVGERADNVVFETPAGGTLRTSAEPGDAADISAFAVPVLTVPVLTVPVPAPRVAILHTLPAVIDGAWWRRHAHLLRYRKGSGLEFRPGAALDDGALPRPPELEADASAFDGLVGQDALLARLRIAAKGSRHFGTCFPHTCFVGPAGTGKTTLARRLSRAVGARLISTSGPLLEDTHTLIGLLATLQKSDMLFLDEIHAVPRGVLETLYEALADQRLALTVRHGSRVHTVELRLPAFTLVAATTEDGKLCDALRSRFGILESLGHYGVPSLAALVSAKACARGFELSGSAASCLAAHARGTPREALRLLDRVLDASVDGDRRLDGPDVRAALLQLGYDAEGLSPGEQRYVATLRASPVPIPLQRLSRLVGASARTLVEHVEPHIFRRGLVEMTPRGRKAVRV